MQSDDELQTTLSKWPFILGDLLLVATALAIAILGDWQLSNWQVAACVMSVALGAALFVLPYVVEFQVRIREEVEDRGADLRILHRQIVATQDQQEALVDQIETLGAGVANLRHSKPDLSADLEAFEQQIEPLRQSREVQGQQLNSLAEQINKLASEVEALTAASEAQVKVEAIDALRSALDGLQSKVDTVQGEVDAVQRQVEALPSRAETASPNAADAKTVEPADEAPSEESEHTSALDDDEADTERSTKKTRAPRQRRHPEPRLIQRAIDDTKDHSSAAVSRIIEYKKKPLAETPPEPVSETASAEIEEDQVSAGLSETAEPVEDALVEDASTEPPAEAEAAELSEVEAVSSEAADPAVDSGMSDWRKSEEAAETEAEDMFAEAVPPQVAKRARINKSDTAIIASVFIGIGNKPYVRGSGAGLNWEAGVPMEFEEIGKWRWLAPADMDGPVEIQLFRNDEDPDTSGRYTLEPGQQLELSPSF
jgi:hypothetical protein